MSHSGLLEVLPANVTKAVESGLRIFARPRGVKAPFAWLVEERSVIVPIIRVIQFHVNYAASGAMTLTVLLLLYKDREGEKFSI